MSEKFNDLSNSNLRKRFFEKDNSDSENKFSVSSIRVSTKIQERGKSFEDQDSTIAEYVKKLDLIVLREWRVAESASKHEYRDHFCELIEVVELSQCTAKPIKNIVFSHWSRASRNPKSRRALERLMELGIALHFARDGVVISNKADLGKYLLWVIETHRSEAFIEELTKNSMAGTMKLIEEGRCPNSKLPFGYVAAGKKNERHFLLDGDRARYMASAFEIIDTTYLADRLTDKLLKAKLDVMYPSIGKTPDQKKFYKLLRDPFYTGEFFTYAGERYRANPEIQPAIVSKDRWLRVQAILDSRTPLRRLSKKLPYTGMMKCQGRILDANGMETDEVCGCSITGEQIEKKYQNGQIQLFDYYRCSNQTRKCSQRDKSYMSTQMGRKVSYRDSEIEAIFQDIFKSFKFDESTCARMTKYLWDEHFEAKKDHGNRRHQLEFRQRELDSFIQRAYEDKLKGVIGEAHWREQDSNWKQEQSQIIIQVRTLSNSQDQYMQRGVKLIELMQQSEIIFKNATPEKKRKMVELVSSNLLLKDGTLQYHWRKPFDLLAEMKYMRAETDEKSWRPQPRLARMNAAHDVKRRAYVGP